MEHHVKWNKPVYGEQTVCFLSYWNREKAGHTTREKEELEGRALREGSGGYKIEVYSMSAEMLP